METAALGIDIGGTKIALGLVRKDGSISQQTKFPTPVESGAEAILHAVVEAGKNILASAREEGFVVLAVGAGTAGQVDHQSGVVTYSTDTLPGWTGMALGAELEHAFGIPVAVDNDVHMMAIGEGQFGAGMGYRHAFYITVGTGIGGAIVLDGRLWRGATFTAGEIGHLLVDCSGRKMCNCGLQGHLEMYASGPAMVDRYHELGGDEPGNGLRAVAERAAQGDLTALQAIREGAETLGMSMTGVMGLFDPQVLVVGGGVAELGDLWWGPFTAALRSNPFPGPARVELRRAQLGPSAVLVGAGWLALTEYGCENN